MRTVSSSMVVVLVTAILTAAAVVPQWGTSTAVAAPEAAFRDLPASVKTGDVLKVQVDAGNGSLCAGSIVYRDNSTQELKEVKESDGHCRWDVLVPEEVRRGEADITVAVRRNDDKVTLNATLSVVRRADDFGLVLRDLPGSSKRNATFTVRLDVPDGASCQGNISYADGKSLPLPLQTENKERCRWDLTTPADVTRGTARLSLVITQEGRSTTLLSSFEIDRDNENADVMMAFQDLPGNVSRDGTLPVRVLVPAGAKCYGEVSFRSADNAKLEDVTEQGGYCRWSVAIPNDAKQGTTDVTVKASVSGKDSSISAAIAVGDSTSSVDAGFKDLPSAVRRGEDLEIRVSVPDGANCQGNVTFDDGAVNTLTPMTEKKDRCLWSFKVPSYTPRGMAIVRIWVDDHGVQTTLTGNVGIEGSENESVPTAWNSLPKEVQLGDSFDVSVNVPRGATCVGRVAFVDGMRWTLGTRDAEGTRCKWTAQAPAHVAPGKAGIEVTISASNGKTTLTGEINVKAAPTEAAKKP